MSTMEIIATIIGVATIAALGIGFYGLSQWK